MTAAERLAQWADEVERDHSEERTKFCRWCAGCREPYPCEAAEGARIVRAMLKWYEDGHWIRHDAVDAMAEALEEP